MLSCRFTRVCIVEFADTCVEKSHPHFGPLWSLGTEAELKTPLVLNAWKQTGIELFSSIVTFGQKTALIVDRYWHFVILMVLLRDAFEALLLDKIGSVFRSHLKTAGTAALSHVIDSLQFLRGRF
jgi:hypothetical protein